MNQELLKAIYGNKLADIRDLLESHGEEINLNETNPNPLVEASRLGHVDNEIIRLLVDRKADVNMRDERFKMTPLEIAVSCEYLRRSKLLIELSADVSHENIVQNEIRRQDNCPLRSAIGARQLKMIDMLIYAKADINHCHCGPNGETPLAFASRLPDLYHNEKEIVEYLKFVDSQHSN